MHVLTSAGRITTCSIPPPATAQRPAPVPVSPVAGTPMAVPALPSSGESMKSTNSSCGSAGSEQAAATPDHEETPIEKPKPKGKAKPNAKRQKVEPTTPLEKGRDLKDKLLKKVTSTTALETQLASVPFADKLLDEIKTDLATFRCCGSILASRVRFGCCAPPHHKHSSIGRWHIATPIEWLSTSPLLPGEVCLSCSLNHTRTHYAAVNALVEQKVDEEITLALCDVCALLHRPCDVPACMPGSGLPSLREGSS